ncbi:MAG TPA: alpha/beta hydrolase [Phycisphaerae bacterium]|nr:alpha/beta hydrolase [Phycisphaerae bacterium]
MKLPLLAAFLPLALLAAAPAPATSPALPPSSAPAAVVDLWPSGKMPGTATTQPETLRPVRADNVHLYTNVSHPTLSLFPAPQSGNGATPAVIVCPGGAYSYVALDLEGSEIATWLSKNGITGIVLKYRVPRNRDGAFQDVQRAISLARENAGTWHIDPKRLGIIGFSAGGNLAAKASTRFDDRSYAPIDAADRQSCRPDFCILVYPAYLDQAGKLSPDLNIHANIPPTLIIHNEDDPTYVVGSKLYNEALNGTKVPHKFLLYPTGGHGYGLRGTKAAHVWPAAALEWLHTMGIR